MTDNTETNSSMLSNNLYNVLKMVVQLLLPASSTLYFTLAAIWNLPYAEQVVGTLAAIATFFGVILGISSRSYNNSDAKYDGKIVTIETEETTLYSLELNDDPENIPSKKLLIFKVEPR